jgi:phage gpG-like protein
MKNVNVKADFTKLENLIKCLNSKLFCDVGILGDEKGEKTTEGKSKDISIASIGAVHEFGADIEVTPKMRSFLHYIGINLNPKTKYVHIPQRSFILMPIEVNEKKITKQLEARFPLLVNEKTAVKFLQEVGIACEGVIQEAFDTAGFGNWQPLHPVTIANKEGEGILKDQGDLRRTITSKVGGKY